MNLNIETPKIIHMYLKDKMSSIKISKYFNCSKKTILNILKTHNINMRNNSESHIGQNAWNKGKKYKCKQYNLSEEGRVKKIENIITEYNLPYKFVGNGEFSIANKVPDFININGEKIAIEVYYRKHKEMFRNGLEKWKQERENLFLKYGWKILFFNEIQVNANYILEKLRGDYY